MKKVLKRSSSILLMFALLVVMLCMPAAAKSKKVVPTGRQTYLTHQVTVYPINYDYPGQEVGKVTLCKYHTVYVLNSQQGTSYVQFYISNSGEPLSSLYHAYVRSDYVARP